MALSFLVRRLNSSRYEFVTIGFSLGAVSCRGQESQPTRSRARLALGACETSWTALRCRVPPLFIMFTFARFEVAAARCFHPSVVLPQSTSSMKYGGCFPIIMCLGTDELFCSGSSVCRIVPHGWNATSLSRHTSKNTRTRLG